MERLKTMTREALKAKMDRKMTSSSKPGSQPSPGGIGTSSTRAATAEQGAKLIPDGGSP
jgi:hypothetical protein